MAKPETHQMRCNWRAKRHLGHTRGWRRNVGKYARDKRGDLPPEVTGGRSQSLRSTVRLKSGARRNGWETGVMLGGAPWSLNSCRGSRKSAGSKTATRDTNGRAVCGRTARTVRRARAFLDP